MKIVILAMLIVMSGCTPPMINAWKDTKINIGPKIVVPSKNEHHWTSGRADTVWCKNHQKWETISVTYKPTILSKLRYKEYEVETDN